MDTVARRVVRAAWPGVVEFDDVCKLTRLVLSPIFERALEVGCSYLVLSGGWPCQDVSFLKAGNRAECARSLLFREFVRVSGVLSILCQEKNLRFVGLGECTKMALRDRERITSELGWTRVELCSSGASRGRRPRNY